MTVTPHMIKELRDITGVGIGKCKEALEEANGNIDEAISILRKAGLASAAKKEGRAANEGKIASAESGKTIAVVEVNAETDFVVNNERFQNFLNDIAQEIAATKPNSLEEFMMQKFSKDSSMTIDEYRASMVQAIGENIQIKRFKTFVKNSSHSIGVYSHLGGKMLTVVEIEGSDAMEDLAKDIAMHVAATSPEYISAENVPESIIKNEREIARSQVQGKPEFVADKIVEGKISKFYDDTCLERQPFIKDDSLKIGDLVKKHGGTLKISNFIRWTVGQ